MDKLPQPWRPPAIKQYQESMASSYRDNVVAYDNALRRDFASTISIVDNKLKISGWPAIAVSTINLFFLLFIHRPPHLNSNILPAITLANVLLVIFQTCRLEYSRDKLHSLLTLEYKLHVKILSEEKLDQADTIPYQPNNRFFIIEQLVFFTLLSSEVWGIGIDNNEQLMSMMIALWCMQFLICIVSFVQVHNDIRTKIVAFFPYIEDPTHIRVASADNNFVQDTFDKAPDFNRILKDLKERA